MFNTGCSRTFVRTSVLFAALTRHTLRLWALTRPSAQPTVPGQREQAFNPGIALMMFVTEVVGGGYRVLTKHSIATWDYFVCHGDS